MARDRQHCPLRRGAFSAYATLLRSAAARYSEDVRLAPGQPILQPGMTELIRCTDLPDDAQPVRLLQEGRKTPWELAFDGKPYADQLISGPGVPGCRDKPDEEPSWPGHEPCQEPTL